MKQGLHIDKDGNKRWYQNDHLHRTDGPALIFSDGEQQWWINGQRYTEQEFNIKYNLNRIL